MGGKLLVGCGAVVLALLNLASVGCPVCPVMPTLASVVTRFTKAVTYARVEVKNDLSVVESRNWFESFGKGEKRDACALFRIVIDDLLEEEWMMTEGRSLEETLASPTVRKKYFSVAQSNYFKHMLKDVRALRSERIRRRRMRISQGPSSVVLGLNPLLEWYYDDSNCKKSVREIQFSFHRLLGNTETSFLPDFARLLYLEWLVIKSQEPTAKKESFLEKFEETLDLIKKSNFDMIDERLDDARKRLKAIYTAPPMTEHIAHIWSQHFSAAARQAGAAMEYGRLLEAGRQARAAYQAPDAIDRALKAHRARWRSAADRARESIPVRLARHMERELPENETGFWTCHFRPENGLTRDADLSEEEKKKKKVLKSNAWDKVVFDECQRATTKALWDIDLREYGEVESTERLPSLQLLASYAVNNRNVRVLPDCFDDHRQVLLDFTWRISPPAEDREDTASASCSAHSLSVLVVLSSVLAVLFSVL